ncbi:MAG: Na+/H+ antiporter subunit E, partial [Alkalibacterium sp.]|nr:Na+/H+ antiporter subunit E [Alkalibacterium sp.]
GVVMTHILLIFQGLLKNMGIILLLSIIWVILVEQFSVPTFFMGLVVSIIVVFFTNRFLLNDDYQRAYMLGPLTFLEYGLRLFKGIWFSGFSVIPHILSGEADVQIITCETKLKDELLITILANSITLTPGTVTVDKKGSRLQVLALNPPADDDDARDVIPYKLEKVLLRYENRIKERS